MELVVRFLVFFLVYGSLHYLFSERKRRTNDGQVQPLKRAILRTVVSAAVAGFLFVLLFEVLELF